MDAATVHRRRWLILASCPSASSSSSSTTRSSTWRCPPSAGSWAPTSRELQWIVDAYASSSPACCWPPAASATASAARARCSSAWWSSASPRRWRRPRHRRGQLIAARAPWASARRWSSPPPSPILTNVFTDAERAGQGHRHLVGVTGLAVALGPVTGGCLLEHFWWGRSSWSTCRSWSWPSWPVPCSCPTSRDPDARRSTSLGLLLSIAAIGTAGLRHDRGARAGAGPRADHARRLRRWPPCCSPAFVGVGARSPTRCSTCGSSATRGSPRPARSVAVAFFALFGFIFLITQYFQFVPGLLAALGRAAHAAVRGRRSASPSPLGARLAVRVGTNGWWPAGWSSMAVGFVLGAPPWRRHAYSGPIVGPMVLIGGGLG